MKLFNKLTISIFLMLMVVWSSAFANSVLYIVTPSTEIAGLPFTVDLYLNTSYIPSTVNVLNFDLMYNDRLTLNTQSVIPFFMDNDGSGTINDLFSASFNFHNKYMLIDRLTFVTNISDIYSINLATEIPNPNGASIFSDTAVSINIIDYNFPLPPPITSSVPEPAAIWMFLIGLLILCFCYDFKTKNN